MFFNPDERKDATLDDAKAALAELEGGEAPDPATLEAGDRTMMKSHFVSVDQVGITRQMGGGFAESVIKLEPGQWHGPVVSGYGVHLVYVFVVKKGVLPPFNAVKDKVLAAWF